VKKDVVLLNTASKNQRRFPDRYAAPYTEGKMSQIWYRPSNIRANPPKGLKNPPLILLVDQNATNIVHYRIVSSWKGR